MTDLDRLPLPLGVVEYLSGITRQQEITDHVIAVTPHWWETTLTEHNLPGGPLDTPLNSDTGRPSITRGLLFVLAQQTGAEVPQTLRLLWHVLAWGTGTRARNNTRRIRAVALDPYGCATALHEAGQLAATDPAAAFTRLRPGPTNTVAWLGPAFFSKYLYFTGGGAAGHPSLILDARVASALRYRCGWDSLHPGGPWPAVTYARYCSLLARWAREASQQAGRPIAADELERWLFSLN